MGPEYSWFMEYQKKLYTVPNDDPWNDEWNKDHRKKSRFSFLRFMRITR